MDRLSFSFLDRLSFSLTHSERIFPTLGHYKIILMFGRKGAGKKTIFEEVKSMSVHKESAFEVELEGKITIRGIVLSRNVLLVVWDQIPTRRSHLLHSDFLREFWRCCCRNVVAVVNVVDSRRDCYLGNHSCQRLQHMISNQSFKGAAVLIFANKQDDPEALVVRETHSGLGVVIWSLYPPQRLYSIKEKTYLGQLPDPIFEIILEYCAMTRCICSPSIESDEWEASGSGQESRGELERNIERKPRRSLRSGNSGRRSFGRKYHIAGVSGQTGEGIKEGMEWIRQTLRDDGGRSRDISIGGSSPISTWFNPSFRASYRRPSPYSHLNTEDTDIQMNACCVCLVQ